MIKLVKETTKKKYNYGVDNSVSEIVTSVLQYHYDSEDTKHAHKLIMEQVGFSDSGQVKENLGSIEEDNFVWFGSYHKTEVHECKEVALEFDTLRKLLLAGIDDELVSKAVIGILYCCQMSGMTIEQTVAEVTNAVLNSRSQESKRCDQN